ncbi:Thioredoxin [Limimonas halophila]|uniref:Thioredoxin n=1 Tax=Limimonas halophila TaxID=1082479 RepID=A0A1G7KY97_9PROT|nr:DsbA family protein [Limimonas halophila]SDF42227.1 Thioredoxin [Limimonas halophila]
MKLRTATIASVLALLAALALAPGQPARAQSAQNHAEHGRVMGDPDAPITIVEFASLTCPHCAHFHRDTLPKLKENWIEPGKAKLIYRHYPLDRPALRAAMAANCFEGDRFFAVLEMMFDSQAKWARAQEPTKALGRIAGMAGMDKGTFESCVNDDAEAESIVQQQLQARKEIGIQSTPTFLIDGEKLAGNQPYDKFVEALEAAQ